MKQKTFNFIFLSIIQILIALLVYEYILHLFPLSKKDISWTLMVEYTAKFFCLSIILVNAICFFMKFSWVFFLFLLIIIFSFDSFIFDAYPYRPNRVIFNFALTNLLFLSSVFIKYIISVVIPQIALLKNNKRKILKTNK